MSCRWPVIARTTDTAGAGAFHQAFGIFRVECFGVDVVHDPEFFRLGFIADTDNMVFSAVDFRFFDILKVK